MGNKEYNSLITEIHKSYEYLSSFSSYTLDTLMSTKVESHNNNVLTALNEAKARNIETVVGNYYIIY